MKKAILFASAGLLLVVLILFSLLKNGKEKNTFPEIRWTEAALKPLEETISASGEFRPRTQEILYSTLPGRVEEIRVEEGDYVSAGQTLLLLEDEDYRQQVLQAEASLERIRRSIRETLLSYRLEYRSSEISLNQSREKLAKQEELFKLEAITEEELKRSQDTVETEEQNLVALGTKLNLMCGLPLDGPPLLTGDRDEEIIDDSPDVKQQRLSLEGARRDLARCTIKAGTAGRIVKINPDRGTLVASGTNLIVLQGSDPLEAVVTVDEVDIGKLKEGDRAVIKSDSLIGEEIAGEIVSLSPILELYGNTRAGEVTIALGETTLPLRSGASCVVEITTVARTSALTIPVAAIATERGRITAFRLVDEEGKTRLEEVELNTGISTINDLEILEGVQEGDRFALPEGDTILRDGLYVTPLDEEGERQGD